MLAGFLFLIISFVIRNIEAVLTMKYYLMPAYFPVWSKLMMPSAGPPPAIFTIVSVLFSLFTGLVLAMTYAMIKDLLPAKFWGHVLCFASWLFVLSFVFFTLPVYLMINLPVGLLVSWLISSAVIFFLGSMIFVKIIKT